MQNELVKRAAWMGLTAGIEALVSIVAFRVASFVWRRVFGEEPPQ